MRLQLEAYARDTAHKQVSCPHSSQGSDDHAGCRLEGVHDPLNTDNCPEGTGAHRTPESVISTDHAARLPDIWDDRRQVPVGGMC